MISATAFRRARRSRAARELDRAETVRLVSLVALTAAVVATSLQLVTIALASTDTSAWTLHLVVLDVACLLVVLIARLGFVRVAEVVLVAAIWAFFTDAAWTAGGTSAPAVAGQLVVVILAALLLGWRGSLVAGVAGVLTVFGLAVAQSIGRLPPSSVEQTAYSRALVLASCVVVVAVMATEMTRTLQRARRRLEGQLDQT